MTYPRQLKFFPGPVTDPLFASVVLLAHFDGTNGATSFTESSSNGRLVSGTGTAQLTTSGQKFGSAASITDDTLDYWSVGTQAVWKFLHDKSTAWCFEVQVRPDNFAAERVLIDTSGGTTLNTGMFISIDATRNIKIQIFRGVGGTFVLNALFPAAYPNDIVNYHHLAVTYDPFAGANNCTLYIDGVPIGQVSQTANAANNVNPLHTLTIGMFGGGTLTFRGHMDEMRITSALRYAGAFTPPTVAFPDS